MLGGGRCVWGREMNVEEGGECGGGRCAWRRRCLCMVQQGLGTEQYEGEARGESTGGQHLRFVEEIHLAGGALLEKGWGLVQWGQDLPAPPDPIPS